MIAWPILVSGFTMGAAGSLHCIGMCGPLSLALPVHRLSPVNKFFSLLLYQAGRIITYSAQGLILGLAGRRVYITGYQQWFSIGMGILVLTLASLYYFQQRTVHFAFLNRFYHFIQQQMGRLLRSAAGPQTFLLMGMANGLLPCGMIYIALASTLSLTQVQESVLFMSMFGAGTLPAMMLAAYAAQWIKPSWRIRSRKWIPVFIAIMGVVLILRGLDLGLPFISPAFPPEQRGVVICHP